MFINKAISMIMKTKKVKQKEMAILIGKSKATDIGARLHNKNMSINTVLEMIDVLNYELVLQEKKSGVRRADQYLDRQRIALNDYKKADVVFVINKVARTLIENSINP